MLKCLFLSREKMVDSNVQSAVPLPFELEMLGSTGKRFTTLVSRFLSVRNVNFKQTERVISSHMIKPNTKE